MRQVQHQVVLRHEQSHWSHQHQVPRVHIHQALHCQRSESHRAVVADVPVLHQLLACLQHLTVFGHGVWVLPDHQTVKSLTSCKLFYLNQSLKQFTKNNSIPQVSAAFVFNLGSAMLPNGPGAVVWLCRLDAYQAHNSDRRPKTEVLKFSVLFDAATPQVPLRRNSHTTWRQYTSMTPKWFVWSKSKATAALGFKPMSRLNNGHLRRHSVSFSARQRSNGTPSGGKDEMEKKAPTSGRSEQSSRRSPALSFSSGNGATKLKPRAPFWRLS